MPPCPKWGLKSGAQNDLEFKAMTRNTGMKINEICGNLRDLRSILPH